jgi:adenylosuccinate lyase
MIDRDTLPEMGHIWSDAHKYELWCQVEVLVLEAHAKAGTVPAEAVAPVRSAPPPTAEAVAAVEAVTDHDVIAFLTAWADNTHPRSAAAYVHYGMTSSDLLDTALAIQLTEATDLILAKADRLVAVLRDHALAHKDTLRPGRTHGIHAEPDVWGHRVADFAFAAARSRDRIRRAREAVAVGTLSGPVGTYSNIDPSIEAEVMPALGLRPADVATQVVIRDGIAEWVSALAVMATVCEAVALEVRHGQRTRCRAVGAVPGSAEGLIRHAAQEEPDPLGADLRPRARGALLRDSGHGRDPALARAGHLPLQRGTDRAAGRGDRHGLPAALDDRAGRGPRRERGPDAGQPGLGRRPDLLLGGAP